MMIWVYLFTSVVSAIFQVKSLYEVHQYHHTHMDTLQNAFPYVLPIARTGLVTSSSIAAGDLLLKVPASRVLTTFDDFPWASYFEHESLEMRTMAMLAYYKLTMEPSPSKELVDSLEYDLDTPTIWGDEELKVLSGYTSYSARIPLEDPRFEHYKEITMAIPDVRALAYEEDTFYWCLNTIRTTSVNISKAQWRRMHGEEPLPTEEHYFGYAFFPLFDLINKPRAPDLYHPDPYPIKFTTEGVEIYADRNYQPFEEVYIPYGHLDNYENLNSRGTVLYYNSRDTIEVDERSSPKCSSGQCLFLLGNRKVNEEYLAFLSDQPEPELAYRRGVRRTLDSFVHDLRSHRRRVKILLDHNYRQAFHLGITERWNAYAALANIDRRILRTQLDKLGLTN